MIPHGAASQVMDFKNGSKLLEPTLQSVSIAPADGPNVGLKERISNTVKAAKAQREIEVQQAADRVSAERLDIQRRAIAALLSLLSDDAINLIIGQHASLGELHAGTIKVTRHGVELIRSGSTGAALMSGEKLDIGFNGPIPQSGQQLKSKEFQERTQQLLVQGIAIVGTYDASGQSVLITFDYSRALT